MTLRVLDVVAIVSIIFTARRVRVSTVSTAHAPPIRRAAAETTATAAVATATCVTLARFLLIRGARV